ncbi:hypothetical protein D9M68_715360 [compost metagenome]
MPALPERSALNHLTKAGTQPQGHGVQVFARLAERGVAGFGENLVLCEGPGLLEVLAALVLPLFKVVMVEVAGLDAQVAAHHV